MGKSFYSPEASGIYMSMVVRPDCDVRDANLLTIAAAAAVAESIELVCDVKVGIKWVNDLFVEQRKVCGILTEAAVGVEEQRLRYAVVGIGINVAPPAGGYPAEIADVATSIYTQPPQTEIRNRLAAEVLRRFQPYAEALPLKAYFSSYRERLFVIGREVALVRGGAREMVQVLALNDDGSLHVRRADGSTKDVASGEVSLRF